MEMDYKKIEREEYAASPEKSIGTPNNESISPSLDDLSCISCTSSIHE